MRMAWHGIPHAVWFQDSHPHHQLAALQYVGVDKLIDRSHIGSVRSAEMELLGIIR